MGKLSAKGIQFTESHEGVIPYIYDDAVSPTRMWNGSDKVKGHLTAGVGHLVTKAEISKWTGKSIPRVTIDAWFDVDNNRAEAEVTRLVKVPISQNQFDVLVDFEFNTGALAKSTLLKVVNAGQFGKVPDQLMRWTKTRINGVMVESDGLKKRCSDRVAMWNYGTTLAPAEPATNVPSPAPEKTSPVEWGSLAVSGISGLSGLSGVGGFVGVAIGVVLIGAFIIVAGLVIKKQFFPS